MPREGEEVGQGGNEGAGEEGMGSKDEWKKVERVNLAGRRKNHMKSGSHTIAQCWGSKRFFRIQIRILVLRPIQIRIWLRIRMHSDLAPNAFGFGSE